MFIIKRRYSKQKVYSPSKISRDEKIGQRGRIRQQQHRIVNIFSQYTFRHRAVPSARAIFASPPVETFRITPRLSGLLGVPTVTYVFGMLID
jgi:hypothetical protein